MCTQMSGMDISALIQQFGTQQHFAGQNAFASWDGSVSTTTEQAAEGGDLSETARGLLGLTQPSSSIESVGGSSAPVDNQSSPVWDNASWGQVWSAMVGQSAAQTQPAWKGVPQISQSQALSSGAQEAASDTQNVKILQSASPVPQSTSLLPAAAPASTTLAVARKFPIERPYVRHISAEVYVTRVKKHNEKPMAYVTFSSPEVAQLVHMTPPSSVGGIPVLPPRQHQSDPNSLVLKWQEGVDLPEQLIVQDFAAFAAAYTGQGIVTGVKKHAHKSMAFVTFFSPTLAQAVMANPPAKVCGTPVLPPRPHQTDANSIVLKWNDSVQLESEDIAVEFDGVFTGQVGQPLPLGTTARVLPAAPAAGAAAGAFPSLRMPMMPGAGQLPSFRGQMPGTVNMGLGAAGGGLMGLAGMMPGVAAAGAFGGGAFGAGLTQASTGAMSAGVTPAYAELAAQMKRMAEEGCSPAGSDSVANAGGLQAVWANKRQKLSEAQAQSGTELSQD